MHMYSIHIHLDQYMRNAKKVFYSIRGNYYCHTIEMEECIVIRFGEFSRWSNFDGSI